MAASSTPPPRSAALLAPMAFLISSMPARQSGRCLSMSAHLCCDMLSAPGRKFLRGPRGTGFLYIRRGLMEQLEPPMVDLFGAHWVAPDRYELRPDARRYETWESNCAARLGLGVAIDYALALGIEAIGERARAMAGRLRAALRSIAGVAVHDLGPDPAAIVTFSIAGLAAEEVKQTL